MSDEPRGEIEIIPPGKKPEDDFATSRIWISSGSGEVKFVKLGPFQSLLLGVAFYNLDRPETARPHFARAAQHEKTRKDAKAWLQVLDKPSRSTAGTPEDGAVGS